MDVWLRFNQATGCLSVLTDGELVYPVSQTASVEFVRAGHGKDFSLRVKNSKGETKVFGSEAKGDVADSAVANHISAYLTHDLTDK